MKNPRTAQYMFGIRIPIKLKLYNCQKKNCNRVSQGQPKFVTTKSQLPNKSCIYI